MVVHLRLVDFVSVRSLRLLRLFAAIDRSQTLQASFGSAPAKIVD